MSETVEHLSALGRIIRDQWYWIAGSASAIWYASIRAKRVIFREYVTNSQMIACKDQILEQIEVMRKENNEGIRENAQQHQDILNSVVSSISELRRNL